MVALLEASHGCFAAQVAEFFTSASELRGDGARAAAWTDVASRIRLRLHLRLLADGQYVPQPTAPVPN
jgi:hypothetical protein